MTREARNVSLLQDEAEDSKEIDTLSFQDKPSSTNVKEKVR